MNFFWQGEIETRYGLDFRSYFATLGSDRPLLSEFPRCVRALPVGKIRLLAIALEESDYTKTGRLAETSKALDARC
jgi:hypothetical protein